MWNKVSTELKSKGFNYSPDQVQGIWKSLARGYKNVKDHNKKKVETTGNAMNMKTSY